LALVTFVPAGGPRRFKPSFRRGAGAPRIMSGLPRFAVLGEKPLFAEAKPTGNLYQPSIDKFLGYSRVLYQSKRYTDDGELCRMLESRLAEFHAVRRVVSVNSGFWGHVLALRALALPGRR